MKKVIKGFQTQGGKHCITGALHQVFGYYGCPLSEEMLFGLGEGLDFTYINLAASPMVSGRAQIIEFERRLASRLGITIRIRKPKEYRNAAASAKKMIDAECPVLIYADMPYLSYLGMNKASHFGGHSVVVFGYDDKTEQFYVSDRDNSDFPIRTPGGQLNKDHHLVSYEEMEKARSSSCRPFPAKNKYAEFDFTGYAGVSEEMLKTAIGNTCENMLNPPARLKGLSGILKFAEEIRKWKRFDDAKLTVAGITNYFQIHADGGTGGGIFRSMFGGFLREAGDLTGIGEWAEIGGDFVQLAEKWDQLAVELWRLSEEKERGRLEDMSEMIADMYREEKELLERLLCVS